MKNDIKTASYDESIRDITNQTRVLEDKRDVLNMDLRNLSLQADTRAKLDINRAEIKKRSQDIEAVKDTNNERFRRLIGQVIRIESMEADVEKALR